MSLNSRLLIAFALATAASACAVPAHADDPRWRALRGIEALRVSVGTYAGSGAGNPTAPFSCPLDRAGIEQRGASMLRSAGFKPLTLTETMARNRAFLNEVKRDIQALQAGSGSSRRDPEEANRRGASTRFMLDLPSLLVRVVAEPAAGPRGGTFCAVAMYAAFVAPPRGRQTVATNSADVMADLLLWEGPPLLGTVPAAELEDAAYRRLEEVVGAFVAAWRTENARWHAAADFTPPLRHR